MSTTVLLAALAIILYTLLGWRVWLWYVWSDYGLKTRYEIVLLLLCGVIPVLGTLAILLKRRKRQ